MKTAFVIAAVWCQIATALEARLMCASVMVVPKGKCPGNIDQRVVCGQLVVMAGSMKGLMSHVMMERP